MGLNIMDINVFYSTFTNVFYFCRVFTFFNVFYLFFYHVFYIYGSTDALVFLFIPCGRVSWLPVSFLLHVKYTTIVSYRMLHRTLASNLDKLQVTQNSVARVVCQAPHCASATRYVGRSAGCQIKSYTGMGIAVIPR